MFVSSDAESHAQRRLADALPILVMISDADGSVNFFNKRWHEFTGQPAGSPDLLTTWQNYMHPEDGPRVAKAWAFATQRRQRSIIMRYRLRARAGQNYRWFSAHAVAVEDEHGKIVQWIGAAVDIDDELSARDATEQLLLTQTSVAETYQRASLPAALPQVEGVFFDARYRAGTHVLLVGGDWYDVFLLAPRRIAVSIGDVAGHSLSSAIVMNKIRQSARAVALWEARTHTPDPAAIVDAMEQALMDEAPGVLVTALFAIIDLDANTLHYATAGHPSPVVRYTNRSVEELAIGNAPLGFGLEATRTTMTASLDKVDHIVFYTDGIIEGGKDALDGSNRLSEALRAITIFDPHPSLTLLSATEQTFRDDAAIVVARIDVID
jgi:PAS domain S-box-containing protein